MYHHAGTVGTAAAAGALPFTGFNAIWFVLAGFALLAAGTSLLRMVPRREG
jgi:LPXTG-motif cell wall-anchored protein